MMSDLNVVLENIKDNIILIDCESNEEYNVYLNRNVTREYEVVILYGYNCIKNLHDGTDFKISINNSECKLLFISASWEYNVTGCGRTRPRWDSFCLFKAWFSLTHKMVVFWPI